MLHLQSEIAATIATQVHAALTPAAERRFQARPPTNPEAHDEYLKGLYFAQKHTIPAILRARDHFQNGIRLAPDYPLPYAGFADVLSCSPLHTWMTAAEGVDATPRAVMNKAHELANRAIELDADLPEALTALGLVELFRNRNWAQAEGRMRQAIELNPSYEFAHRALGMVLAFQGRFDGAKQIMERALELDPFNAQVASMAGGVYWFSGDTERALAHWQEATALDAAFPVGLQHAAVAHCSAGHVDLAEPLFERARALSSDDPLVVGDLAHCYAISGRTDESYALLRELEARADTTWVSPLSLGLIQLGLGNQDAALDELERADRLQAYRMFGIGVDPRWDPIRETKRFNALIEHVGLASG